MLLIISSSSLHSARGWPRGGISSSHFAADQPPSPTATWMALKRWARMSATAAVRPCSNRSSASAI
eukprot:2693874-Pyramimonas_sp.AAC.1